MIEWLSDVWTWLVALIVTGVIAVIGWIRVWRKDRQIRYEHRERMMASVAAERLRRELETVKESKEASKRQRDGLDKLNKEVRDDDHDLARSIDIAIKNRR